MNNKQFIRKLQKIQACQEAVDFVKENDYSMQEAWDNCVRADWLLWLMVNTEMATQKERIHIICDCAATALKYVPKGEDRPRLAIEATRRYADNPTEENNAARAAARAAAWDAASAAAWDAASVAAWAASAVARAARAAAGTAAQAAARAAAWDAAWAKICKHILTKYS